MPTYHIPKVLTPRQQDQLLQNCQSKKYRVILLLMLDCGLRVTEAIRLQLKHFNFMENYVVVESLKKRRTKHHRQIPLTQRLLDAISTYWQELKTSDPEAYLFPANKSSKQKYLSRKQVWRKVKKLSNGQVYPHMLRHTFATRIVNNGNELRIAKELLGHKSIATTEIYTHVSAEQIKTAIASIDKETWLTKLYRKLVPRKPIHVLPIDNGITKFHIGRKEEIERLFDLGKKKINILITGPQGVGKTHLLEQYNLGKIIKIGDFSSTKKLLTGMLLYLFTGDKEDIAKTMYEKQLSKNGIETIIYKETIKRLTELLIQVTQKHEYTLLIDDVSRVPPSGVSALEKLKNHFHIICAARQVKITNISFLTNFERIDLKPFSRTESIELINRMSQPIMDRIEDYETYKNHIFENTNGNPLFIIEMIERYRKEPFISLETVKNYRHTAAYKELDVTLFLVIVLSSLMVLRYVSGEIGDDSGAFRLIGGIFLMFALFARNIFRLGKRKFV